MKRKNLAIILVIAMAMILTACGNTTTTIKANEYTDWEQVIKDGTGKTVAIFMWGGNESINKYMDTFVADYMKETYQITLKRVPMVPPEYLPKLINEKKSDSAGTGDVLWINAENFLTAKSGELLSGPFTTILPNQQSFYDTNASDLKVDAGISIEGYEAIWGRAQLVFTYDEALTPNPPKNYEELLTYAMENPGKITFPKIPDDFVGTTFFKNAFYELTGKSFSEDMTEEQFIEKAKPVVEYFKQIKPYLWNDGNSFPSSQAQLDELFKNGEVHMTMGFEVGKTAGLIASGIYPETVRSYVFESGTIGNSHYLAIPFNAPQPAAALLLIDFLQSPLAQIEKMKTEVWGDMPAFDVAKIDVASKMELDKIEKIEGVVTLEDLTTNRLPDMGAKQTEWVKTIWTSMIIQ